MSISTSTLLDLVKKVSETHGDYLTFATTTNITTNNSIISTTLKQYDNGDDGAFNGWWVYLNTTANPSVLRKTGLQAGATTYATATGTLTIAGAVLAAESAAATCYLFKYNRSHYVDAIVETCKTIYPTLHKRVDNQTLVTGNILPDAHFEEWPTSSTLTWYSVLSGTLAQTSTAGLTRGGKYSAKYTAGATPDYFYISSDSYPRLLDLQGRTVNFYCWAYPTTTADDASIGIYTVKNDGTTIQNLTSTTTNAKDVYTQLKLEGQEINDDLDSIQIRFRVKTSGAIVYFDDAYLNGMGLSEYLLPSGFVTGHPSQLFLQTYGNMDEPFYDLHAFNTWYRGEQIPFTTFNDGSNHWLKLLDSYENEKRLRLLGFTPLETLSADTDTITLSSEKVPLLIAQARMIFWSREAGYSSVTDTARCEAEYNKAQADFYRLFAVHSMKNLHELGRV